MGILDEAVDISELKQCGLWTIYGKSGSGKTAFIGTFPKPLLYVKIGDDGSNTIRNVEGIKVIVADTPEKAKKILTEARKDKTYKTVALDTFGLIVNEWVNDNIVAKKKRMTQQSWGDLKTDVDELVRLAHKLSEKKIVVLSLHEIMDNIEGLEDEILPDVRPNINKATRNYLEGMSNFGIHTTKVMKEKVSKKTGETKEVVMFAAHVGANPYYWTKLQVSTDTSVPELVFNPTYDKIMNIINGGE